MSKLPQPRGAWTPPAARIEGDRLLRARAAAQRVADAKVQAEAEASRMQEFATATLDKKVDELRGQLDRLTEDLPKVIPSGGGGRRMVERVFTRDADRYRDALGLGTSATQNIARYPNRAAVSAGAVASDVTNILIDAYTSSAPSAGMANYKAATLTEYNAAPSALRLTDANGRRFVTNEKKFSLDMAGAPNDGTGDCADAFDAVFSLIKTDATASAKGMTRYVIDLAGGVYRVTRPINFTNFTAWNVGIVNGAIIGACAGKPVIDASGGRGYFFDNLFIWGDPTNRPSHGIICPRATVNQFSGSQEFGRLTIDGYFTAASFYAYGMEGAMLRHCMIWNRDFSGRVAIIEGYDAHQVSSDYATPLTGPTSMIWNKVLMTNFRHIPTVGTDPTLHTAAIPTSVTKANPGVVTCSGGHPFQNGDQVTFFHMSGMTQLDQIVATVANRTSTTFELSGTNTTGFGTFTGSGLIVKKASAPPVYVARLSHLNFDTSYIVTWGQPHIELAFPDSSFRKLTHINLDLLYEGAGSPHNVLLTTPGAVTCAITGLNLKSYNSNALESFMSVEGGGAVQLWDTSISVYDALYSVDLCDLPASLRLLGGTIAYRTAAATGYASMPLCYGNIIDLTNGKITPVGTQSVAHPANGSFTPTVTASSGGPPTLTSATATFEKMQGDLARLEYSVTINSNAGASGELRFGLPSGVTGKTGSRSFGTGWQTTSGKTVRLAVSSAGTYVRVQYDDSTYPGADGVLIQGAIVIQIEPP